jgi:DNA polymerase-1
VDIHTKTAAEAYGVAIEDVSPTQRRNAKVINFGVLYGMSPRGLSEAAGMSFTEAKEFIERYFRLRQPLSDYIKKTVAGAEKNGYVQTLFGRRRPTPNINVRNFVAREAARRQAANMPIQGTEADLMQMAMIRVEKQIPQASQFMQIHDSIMVECDPADVAAVSAQMKQIMENIYPQLKVRLKVDVKSGKNWGEL